MASWTDIHPGTFGITKEELAAHKLVLDTKIQKERSAKLRREHEENHATTSDAYDPEQVRQLAKLDLNWLAAIAMPEVFAYKFPPVLIAAWYLMSTSVMERDEDPKIALGIPRGFAKTTLIKLFVLYCILFTDVNFILIISATASLAENVLADIADMMNQSNIKELWGNWRLGMETDRGDLKKFHFLGKDIILATVGAEGSLRGINIKNRRPELMIFEDVQTKENAASFVQAVALETWMLGTAMKAKSPRGCLFLFAGNMYPGRNSILKKIKANPNWKKFISGAILSNGESLWPKHRSVRSLIAELENDIASGHPEIFFSEVMNDTEVGINTKVDISKIRPWKWGQNEQPQGKFILIDPSGDKTGSDPTAIGYFEVFDEVPALRQVVNEVLSPGNTIRRSLLVALKTGTRCIVVEANSYQHSLLYWFTEVARELGLTGFYFVPIYSTSKSKNARIATGLKELTAGEIYLHSDVRSLITTQIANWNPLKKDNVDDLLDLLSYSKRSVQEYGPLIMTDTHLLVIEADSAGVLEDNSCF